MQSFQSFYRINFMFNIFPLSTKEHFLFFFFVNQKSMLKTDMKHFWDIKIKNVTKIHTKSVILVKHLGKNKLYFSKIKKKSKRVL